MILLIILLNIFRNRCKRLYMGFFTAESVARLWAHIQCFYRHCERSEAIKRVRLPATFDCVIARGFSLVAFNRL